MNSTHATDERFQSDKGFQEFQENYSLIVVAAHLTLYFIALLFVSCVAAKDIQTEIKANKRMKWHKLLKKWCQSINVKRKVYMSLIPYLFDQAVK